MKFTNEELALLDSLEDIQYVPYRNQDGGKTPGGNGNIVGLLSSGERIRLACYLLCENIDGKIDCKAIEGFYLMDLLPDGRPVTHLGDGAYAVWCGYGVELRANHHEHPTDTVFLEDFALDALINFREMCRIYQLDKMKPITPETKVEKEESEVEPDGDRST